MNNIRIFIDFGSTFTKAVAFDLEKEELIARVQVPSTVDTDISTGLHQAFDKLSETIPVDESNIKQTLACSSAAGGLRMICMGLVPEYTTEAGRLAALGAGAGRDQPRGTRAHGVGAGHFGAGRRPRARLCLHPRRHHRAGRRPAHLGLGRCGPPHRS